MSGTEPQPWTIERFDEELARYDASKRPRDIKLVAWLFGIWGSVFVALAVPGFTGHYLPEGVVIGLAAVLFLDLIALAGYIAATTGSFHSQFGVRCPSCRVPQIYSGGERLILIPYLKRNHSAIRCQTCRAVIAQF